MNPDGELVIKALRYVSTLSWMYVTKKCLRYYWIGTSKGQQLIFKDKFPSIKINVTQGRIKFGSWTTKKLIRNNKKENFYNGNRFS